MNFLKKRISVLVLLLSISNSFVSAAPSLSFAQKATNLLTAGKQFITDKIMPGKFKTFLGASALIGYLTYVRMDQEDLGKTVKEAKKYTKVFYDMDSASTTDLMHWQFSKWQNPTQVISEAEIYQALYKTFKKSDDESRQVFNARMKERIAKEIMIINILVVKLNHGLYDSSILPSLLVNDPDGDRIIEIIKQVQKENQNNGRHLHEMPYELFLKIENRIKRETKLSPLHPLRLMRWVILPYEYDAMKESWKLRVLLSRLQFLNHLLEKNN